MSKKPRISLAVADIRVVRHFGGDGEHFSDGWTVKAKLLHGGSGCPHIALASFQTAPNLSWCFYQIEQQLMKPEFQTWLRDHRKAAPRNLPDLADIAEVVWAKVKATIRGEAKGPRRSFSPSPWSTRTGAE